MEYKKCAADILHYIGGEKNIVNLEHCSTRLRFTVANQENVNQEGLKKVQGVMKLIVNSQVQVVIGNSVIEVYDEIMKLITIDESISTKGKKKVTELLLEYLIGIFQPLIPVMAGAGILKSILVLLSTLEILSAQDNIYKVLLSISDATFYFMPIMVAYTTAAKLKTNKMVAIAAVGVLLLPNMTTMLAEGIDFLGMMEKALNKVTPKVIRTFFVPMVALAVTVPVTLMILGPLGYTVGEGLASVIMFLYAKLGFLAVAIVACILPLMVSTGMHKAMIPYVVSSLGTLGYEILYNAASLAHNISESGACFAVAIKSKNEEQKAIAASAGISALMGITEPALYGIALQNQRVLASIMISSGVIGAFLGLVGLKAFVAVGPGLPSITMFVDPDNGMNIVFAVVGLIGALSLSFILTMIFWKDENKKDFEICHEESDKENLYIPLEGDILPLTDVHDEMFSQKVLGEGIAIIPSSGILKAPCDGTVKMVFETKHAIGMEAENGAEILFHAGINTVELEGKYFESHVKAGDKVHRGDVLLKFDIENIKQAGFDCTTPIIITNTADYQVFVNEIPTIEKTGIILTVGRKGK